MQALLKIHHTQCPFQEWTFIPICSLLLPAFSEDWYRLWIIPRKIKIWSQRVHLTSFPKAKILLLKALPLRTHLIQIKITPTEKQSDMITQHYLTIFFTPLPFDNIVLKKAEATICLRQSFCCKPLLLSLLIVQKYRLKAIRSLSFTTS